MTRTRPLPVPLERLAAPSEVPLALDVVERESAPRHRHETWYFGGAEGDRVTAEAYLPTGGEPAAAVVVGHGLGGDRTAPYVQGACKAWAEEGLLMLAGDAPLHGARTGAGVREGLGDLVFLRWAVADLRRLLDALEERAGRLPTGYLGFSMGTLVGVPFMAADHRVGAGVFAIGGSTRVMAEEHGAAEWSDRSDPADYAPLVAPRPVMLLNADRDEIFSRRSALALYDAFSPPKELLLFPGSHAVWEEPSRPYRAALAFLRDRLGS